jgi:ribosomal protein S21
MATNVEVNKNNNESNAGMIKRFTKKVQESGVLPRVRSIRYEERKPSDYKKKKARLKSIKKQSEFDKMFKLGKVSGFRKRR